MFKHTLAERWSRRRSNGWTLFISGELTDGTKALVAGRRHWWREFGRMWVLYASGNNMRKFWNVIKLIAQNAKFYYAEKQK